MQRTKRVKGSVQHDKPTSVDPDQFRDLLARAAEKAGNYARLAALLGRGKSALSQWKQAGGGITDHTLRLLELYVHYDIPLSGDPAIQAQPSDQDREELYIRRRLSKVTAQLIRLAWHTRTHGEQWDATERLLDAWMPKASGTVHVMDVNPFTQVAEVLGRIQPHELVTALFAKLAEKYKTEEGRRAFHRRTAAIRNQLLKLVEQADRETLLVGDVVERAGNPVPGRG